MDVDIKDEHLEIKEETVEENHEPSVIENLGNIALRSEKRDLSNSQSAEASPRTKRQRSQVEKIKVTNGIISTNAEETPVTRKKRMLRRPNYTPAELLCIAKEVEARKTIVLGKLDSFVITAPKKREAWEEIAAAVNVVSCFVRSPTEIRKKFKDMRSVTNQKLTGTFKNKQGIGWKSDSQVTLNPVEEILVRLRPPPKTACLPTPESEASCSNTEKSNASITNKSEGEGIGTPVSPVNTEGSVSQTFPSVDVEESVVLVADSGPKISPRVGANATTATRTQTASDRQPPQGRRTRRVPTIPPTQAGLERNLDLMPDFLHVQQDMRDLLGALAKNSEESLRIQKEAATQQKADAAAQREATAAHREAATALKEAATTLREAATAQQELATSIGLLIAFLQKSVSK